MQVSQDEVAHLGVQLPDAGGHHGDGEGGFVVGRHLFLTLFLRRKKIRSERSSAVDLLLIKCQKPRLSNSSKDKFEELENMMKTNTRMF